MAFEQTSAGSDTADAKRKALLYMLLATLLLALMHSCVRYVGSDLPPAVIVFFRNLFGFVAVLPLILKGGVASMKTQHIGLTVLRAFIGIIAMQTWFYALTKVPIANATALSFSTTIFATLIAWLVLREKMRVRRWAAILVGLLGVYVALQPEASGFNRYALLVLFSAIAWGSSLTIVKVLSRSDSTTSIVGWMTLSLTILSFPIALYYWQTPTATQFTMLILIGALATAGHYSMTTALRMADTAIVMSMDFARLIWVAIIGIFWFGEPLDLGTVIGAIIIFGAGWYIIFREGKLKSK
ncbi:MAG: DMT family transporter [Gammaproteobacteria bacterium]|nr:DMT family transporter [Gammaproteobacteria bacterium]